MLSVIGREEAALFGDSGIRIYHLLLRTLISQGNYQFGSAQETTSTYDAEYVIYFG